MELTECSEKLIHALPLVMLSLKSMFCLETNLRQFFCLGLAKLIKKMAPSSTYVV